MIIWCGPIPKWAAPWLELEDLGFGKTPGFIKMEYLLQVYPIR